MSTSFPEYDETNPYAAPRVGRQQGYGEGEVGPAGPAEVRFSRIGDAWRLVSDRWGTWMLITFVWLVVGGIANLGISMLQNVVIVLVGGGEEEGPLAAVVAIVAGLLGMMKKVGTSCR